MTHADFIHLRVHSAYSLLEGAIKIKDLVDLCAANSMPAVAVTDTCNLFGAMEFSLAAPPAGVQPIIGCQIALRREDRAGPANGGRQPDPDQLILLVQDETGYGNLIKLVSRAFLETDSGQAPQISLEDLESFNDGLIALTGGPKGLIGRLLAEEQLDAAKASLKRLADIYPGRLYIELMRHGLDIEARIEPALLDLAYEHDLPLVATNEAFFADAAMHQAGNALICIADRRFLAEDDRRHLTPEHRFKSAKEMRALFADLPEAVDNTLVIARRCAWFPSPRDPMLPSFPVPDGQSEGDALRQLAEEGLKKRLQAHVYTSAMDEDERQKAAKHYHHRLEYEIDIIIKMGFSGYFLIVADFIQWAKGEGIPVGPGRGSGAGSLVAWVLTITDLDPLRFGLLFERFLNPERVSMPDFDIDFCQDRRDDVIRYVQDKYGQDHVAQIITFGSLQARAALRDVGRVLQLPYGQVDRICKLVPNNPADPVPLALAVDKEPQLQQARREDPMVARMMDMAIALEGLYRHASTHAAGVVIGDRSLDELVPLYRDPHSDMPVTQFSMKYVELAGLVKFDFLGLKTLTVLARAVDFIRERDGGTGPEIDLSVIPLDDPATYDMLGRAETVGVFQLESAGMREVLRGLKPDRFEDIIAVVALYRPGPMDNIPSYIACKHGREKPDYMDDRLEDILKETNGIMIYQEQVMQIAQVLSGYTLGAADLLRRAMGKKIQSEMDAQRKHFVEGAVARGVTKAKANQVFDQVNKFAGYGFNKSHAAAYALVAYQTAYLKANYPVEFLAASMILDINNTDKLNFFRQEALRLGIPVLPPDVNRSSAVFSVEMSDQLSGIRYALGAVKNVGEQAMAELVKERDTNGDFTSLADFAQRLDTKVINKRQLENLVYAGAFDSLEPNRGRAFEAIPAMTHLAGAAAEARNSSQESLFGGEGGIPEPEFTPPEARDWTASARLQHELEALGFYLSAHPLDVYTDYLQRLGVIRGVDVASHLATHPGETKLRLAGTVTAKKERISGKGNRYAFLGLSDSGGGYEVTVFSETLSSAQDLLEVGTPVLLSVEARMEGDAPRLTVQSIAALDHAAADAEATFLIRLADEAAVETLKEALEDQRNGRGRVSLVFYIPAPGGAPGDAAGEIPPREIEMALKARYSLTPAFIADLKSMPGIASVEEITGP